MRRPSGCSPTTCASCFMAPPLGQKTVLAIDPGFRTGCKVVCLDRQGKLLHHDTIYPAQSGRRAREGGRRSSAISVERFEIEAIAIGNGTAGRETETFVRELGLPARRPRGDGQRERRLGLLRLGGRPRGVPGPRCDRARRGLHRPPADGPAGRAGQDRPQVHRRRPVPARCGPGRAQDAASTMWS